ncbi:uncharacterized protein [Pyrus communis]|uniref:uncharacterized protein n=1 Tax=Pyrus communis TaxID=23211 RepID=UPI0035C00317
MVEDVVMPADLIPLDIVDFDVILGTDWLHHNRANIDCYGKTVTFHLPRLPVVTVVGCQGYLAHVVLNDVAPNSMEDVKVVRHFPDIFPDNLPGLPPDRDVEFTIDLLLGTNHISLTPYRMAPAELRELKIQLQELVDKDLRSTGVRLEVEDKEVALLANFQVRPILIDRILEAQMVDEEPQEIIQARNQGKKKDFRVQESDGMLMQESRMFVLNNLELKKAILDEVHILAYAMHPRGSFGYKITLQYDISSSNRRIIREDHSDVGGYVEIFGIAVWRCLAQTVIKSNLKATQDRQKSFANRHATDKVYKVGDWVFLKLSSMKRCRTVWKERVHNVFHVSILRHYVADPSHVIPPQPLEINPDLTYDEEPVTIVDWKEKVLRNKTVSLVKVLWRNHSAEEATWETEDQIRDLYPRLFYGY